VALEPRAESKYRALTSTRRKQKKSTSNPFIYSSYGSGYTINIKATLKGGSDGSITRDASEGIKRTYFDRQQSSNQDTRNIG
jgi:hypothetical protein